MSMESYLFKADEPDKEYGNQVLYLHRGHIVHNWMEYNVGSCYSNEEVVVTEDQLRALEVYLMQYLVGHPVWDCRKGELSRDNEMRCWHVYEIRETLAAIWSVVDPEPDHEVQSFVYRADY